MLLEKLRFRRSPDEPIVLNRNYFHTPSGILKCVQCFLGTISFLSISLGCRSSYDPYLGKHSGFVGDDLETFLLLITFAGLIFTVQLLLLYYFSIFASTVIQKTIFELVHNSATCFLLLTVSLPYGIHLIQRNSNIRGYPFEPGFGAKFTSSIFATINSVAYAADAYYAYQSYMPN